MASGLHRFEDTHAQRLLDPFTPLFQLKARRLQGSGFKALGFDFAKH